MRKLLATMLIALSCVPAAAQTLDRILGLGIDRANLSTELLEIRARRIIDAGEFAVLRHPDSLNAPERLLTGRFSELIDLWSNHYNFDPDLVRAIAFVECRGLVLDCVSRKGWPQGPFQIDDKTMRDMKLRKYTVTVPEPATKLVWKGKGKNRKQVVESYTKKTKVQVDERFDLDKVVQAVVKRLDLYRRIYAGRDDLATQIHHNGPGRMLEQIRLYTGNKDLKEKTVGEAVRQYGLTYAKVYFENTPYFRPKLNKYLTEIPDFGDTYWFNVSKARELLKLYREDPAAYRALYHSYRSPFKADGLSPNRMWYFFKPEDVWQMQFPDLDAIQDAVKTGRLVDLPEPWEKFGILPRLTGTSPIAEADLANQREYLRAETATIGAVLYIMSELRLLQGAKFKPYETNSLVRTSITQMTLRGITAQATATLPTHEWGKAIDFPVLGMDKGRVRDLLFILNELDSYGMISFVPEHALVGKGKKAKRVLATYHVVPHPDPERQAIFVKAYEKAVGYSITVTTQPN
jgi:hypothetical protein